MSSAEYLRKKEKQAMIENAANSTIPRLVPEGTVPLLDFEGTAYDCGKQYGETVLQKYPGYRRYLDPAFYWNRDLSGDAGDLFDQRAPHIPEIFRGIADAAGQPEAGPRSGGDPSGGAPPQQNRKRHGCGEEGIKDIPG